MLRLESVLLVPLMLFPLPGLTADCEVEAQLQDVQIQTCDGERFLGTSSGDGSFVNRVPYDAIPVGLEKFWSELCNCYLWQVSGRGHGVWLEIRFLVADRGEQMPVQAVLLCRSLEAGLVNGEALAKILMDIIPEMLFDYILIVKGSELIDCAALLAVTYEITCSLAQWIIG